MQSSSFQSVPCANPEEAAASAAAMAALATPKGMEHKVVSTVVQEINGLFVAVVVVELTPVAEEAAAEPPPGDNHQDELAYGENDAPDNIYWLAGFNARQMEEFHPFPDTAEPAPDTMPGVAQDVAAPIQQSGDAAFADGGIYLLDTPTGPGTLSEEAPQLAEQLRTDFNEAEPAMAATPAETVMAADLQPDPRDDDDEEGEGGGEDGRARARDVAENQPAPPPEEPAPSLLA